MVFEVFVFLARMHIPASNNTFWSFRKCIISKYIKSKSHGEATRRLYSKVPCGGSVVEPSSAFTRSLIQSSVPYTETHSYIHIYTCSETQSGTHTQRNRDTDTLRDTDTHRQTFKDTYRQTLRDIQTH